MSAVTVQAGHAHIVQIFKAITCHSHYPSNLYSDIMNIGEAHFSYTRDDTRNLIHNHFHN